jgi:DNA-binding beta-propeller fold protein YncE
MSQRTAYGNDQTFTTLADVKPPKLYVVNHGNGGLLVSNLNGSGGSKIGSDISSGGVAIDPVAGKAYYTSGGNVIRINLDGAGRQDLGNPGNFLTQGFGIDLDLTNGNMYIVDASSLKVILANLNGSNAQDLGTLGLLNGPRDIALDVPDNKMYILSSGNRKVVKANLDGSNPQDLGDLGGMVVDASGIALDHIARRMYIATKSFVIWANLDGTGVKNLGNLNNTLNAGFGIVDARAGKLYVSNFDDSTISLANLNGTGGVKLGNPNGLLSVPYGIAVNGDPNQTPVDSIQYQPAGQWFRVASEGQKCLIQSTQTYRYGAGDYWVVKQGVGWIFCDPSFANIDPAPGQAKFLEIKVSELVVTDKTGSWLPIAMGEALNTGFSFPTEQRVRYQWGTVSKWKEKNVTGDGICSAVFFAILQSLTMFKIQFANCLLYRLQHPRSQRRYRSLLSRSPCAARL